MHDGAFYVRLERRGLLGQVMSQEVEREVGEHLRILAQQAGKRLQVSFTDANYIVQAETVGSVCGIALLEQSYGQRYPFVLPR